MIVVHQLIVLKNSLVMHHILVRLYIFGILFVDPTHFYCAKKKKIKGLFKGSTISLNNSNGQQHMYYQQQQQQILSTHHHRPERPKTLRTIAAVRKSTSLENHQKISVTLSTYVPPPMIPSSHVIKQQQQKHHYNYHHHHHHQTHSSDDESNNSSSSGTTTTTTRKKINENITTTTTTATAATTSTILSPFDEQEEWAKISEIMATFGTDFVTDNDRRDFLLKNNRFRLRNAATAAATTLKSPKNNSINNYQIASTKTIEQQQQNYMPQTLFADWLYDNELEHLETILIDNGYDDLDFLVIKKSF